MTIFYTPDIAQTSFLPEEESLHCAKVLRLQVGEIVHLIDGKGGLYTAQIVVAHPKRTEVKVISVEQEFEKLPYNLHLALAPTKNIDRYEWFVEKSTEIGLSAFTPLFSRYSERKMVKEDRVEKVIVSAAKQSLKAYVPQLFSSTSFKEFVQNTQASQKFIAHCNDMPKVPLATALQKGSDVVVMIGPEGDFSPEEVQFALDHGFVSVSLGTSRLRTETAGVVACHTVNLINALP